MLTPTPKTQDSDKQGNSVVSPSCSPSSPPRKQSKKTADPCSSQPPSSANSRRRKRTIKFSKVVHNRRIPHLNDLSHEEIVATWIQPEDYLEIRERCISTVKKMMRGGLTQEDVDSERHCTRGLEGKTRSGSAVRRDHKMDSISAVLEEQTLQWNEEVDDEEAIMEVYTVYTTPCAKLAHEMALEDAQVARAYVLGESSSTESPSVAPQHRPSTTEDGDSAEGVVDRLRGMLFLRSSKTAILHDIENTFYDEVAMERRRNVYAKPNTSALARHLRDYFSTQRTFKTGEDQDIPSLASSQSYESTDTGDDNSDEGSTESENFTTILNTQFHSRKRRQALLDSIERGYFDANENAIVTISVGTVASTTKQALSNVAAISDSLGSAFQDILGIRKQRKAVVDELKASSHVRK